MSEIVRVSHDGNSVVVRTPTSRYATLSTGSSDVKFFSSLSEAKGSGRWRVPSPRDRASRTAAVEIVNAALTELGVTELAQSEKRRVYRVPKGVKTEARRGMRWAERHGIDGDVIPLAKQLASSESVGIEVVERLLEMQGEFDFDPTALGMKPGEEGYPSRARVKHALLGGPNGKAWAGKISRTHKVTLLAGAFEYDVECIYFAGGDDSDTTEVSDLYMLRPDETWSVRTNNGWQDAEAPTRPQLIELDEESATVLADWVDDVRDAEGSTSKLFELQSINPVERNLFTLAYDEVDWTEVDRATEALYLSGMTADAYPGYTPQERSQNAGRQQRSTDGKFGGGAGAGPQSDQMASTGFARARLSVSLPLVEDVNALIDAYLQQVAQQRAGSQTEFAEAPAPTEVVEVPPGESDVRPLYLAIVDSVDTEAVLDVVALVPPPAGQQGDTTAWKRTQSQWVSAPELMADLRGATPPPVVELTDDELIKAVLAQVDTTDGGQPQQPQDANPVTMQEPIQASGMWGPYGEIIPLYGDAGLIQMNAMIAAGGADRNNGNAETLRRYWTTGEGGLKVRWGTDGDMTRCMRQLRKYLGNRAPGYCALRHHEMTGMWPGDRDNRD